jgi:hypothetical protein
MLAVSKNSISFDTLPSLNVQKCPSSVTPVLPVRQLLQPVHEGRLAMTHGTVRQRGAIDIPDETHIVVEVVEASFNLTASVGRIDPGDDLDWSFHRTGFPDDNRSRQSKSQNDLMSTCPVQTGQSYSAGTGRGLPVSSTATITKSASVTLTLLWVK